MNKKISELTAASTPLTGTEELAIVQSGVTKKATVQDVKGYKVYTALLTQTGTTAPVATVLENTIGNMSFTYVGAGLYFIQSSGLFLNDKTWYSILANKNGGSEHINNLTYIDDSTILIETTAGVDDFLIKTPIEIRVYN